MSRHRHSRHYLSEYTALIVFLGFALASVFWGYTRWNRFLPFDTPIAYALMDEHLFIVEHGDRVLDLHFDPECQKLRLEHAYQVEQDDERYYYMVRALTSCEHGVMVRTYIYDKETRDFKGYRYREYDRARKPTDVFTVFFDNTEEFPEIFYTYGIDGSHLFVSGCVGYPCVWQIPAEGGVTMKHDEMPTDIRTFGPVNNELNPWNAILQLPDGTIYLSSVGRGQIIPDNAVRGAKIAPQLHMCFTVNR